LIYEKTIVFAWKHLNKKLQKCFLTKPIVHIDLLANMPSEVEVLTASSRYPILQTKDDLV